MPFARMGLCDPLLRGVDASGYTTPTEIQSQAIPAVLSGQDIIGCAQTGTGKTAAFVLPILHQLHESQPAKKKPAIRVLILTPTRELAVQIEESIRNYGRFLPFRTLAVYGGVSIEKQLSTLRHGVDLVVATPGRLMDHMRRHSISFKSIEVFVLDEADRMFDMGFIRDVRKIIDVLPENRQTLLFSATIPPEVERLATGVQKSPRMIQIGEQRNPIDTITQHVHPVEKRQKIDLLVHMLQSRSMDSVLVFSRTKHGADRINRRLKTAGIVSVAIHSDRSQPQRQRALDGFKNGKYQVMVATDIAARGIDVRGISHVINFDVPEYAQDYIHRIGRTGRACATGDAITLVSPDERDQLRRIERFIGCKLNIEEYEGFTCTHLAATLAQSEEKLKAQRRVARVRRAAKRPRMVHRRRGMATAR
ncbi:MAG: DEAD/DEAH box helicase [Sedimentisphaerales bacterium]|nr:DEAD/DEAH box helicase [Sedimentisphaerales bacterium]